MSKSSYQRLLHARYTQLCRSEISTFTSKLIDKVLDMPHPQREIAFVDLAYHSNPKALMSNTSYQAVNLNQKIYNN